MAQVIRYVDPDAAGSGTGVDWTNAYTSLAAWQAAEVTDLVSAGDYHTVYCRSSSGTDDTSLPSVTGWTTDATHYIEIIGADFPSNGILDTSKYLLHNATGAGAAITVNQQDVYLINLQVQNTTSTNGNGVNITAPPGTYVYMDGCIIKGVCTGTGTSYGIYSYSPAGGALSVYNTLIYDFRSGSDSNFRGIVCQQGYVRAYNCTIYNCYLGFREESIAAFAYAYNCAVGACTDDFSSLTVISNCCADVSEGTNPQTPAGGDWNNEFNNIAGEDFSLKATGNCAGNGATDPGSGLYDDDIIGTLRG